MGIWQWKKHDRWPMGFPAPSSCLLTITNQLFILLVLYLLITCWAHHNLVWPLTINEGTEQGDLVSLNTFAFLPIPAFNWDGGVVPVLILEAMKIHYLSHSWLLVSSLTSLLSPVPQEHLLLLCSPCLFSFIVCWEWSNYVMWQGCVSKISASSQTVSFFHPDVLSSTGHSQWQGPESSAGLNPDTVPVIRRASGVL